MPQDISVSAKGLATNPNYIDSPPGSLDVADDVVISRPGVLEPRRGYDLYLSGADVQKLIYLDHEVGPRIIAFTGSNPTGTLAYGWLSQTATTATFNHIADITPYGFVRSFQANQNLYLTTMSGVYRQAGDPTGTQPMEAGVEVGFIGNVDALAPGSGSAIASDCQVAYRVAWTYTDESGIPHVGPPSGRSTYINQGVQFGPGEMVVVSGTATITPTGGHPFVSGQLVFWGEDALTEPNIAVGDYSVIDSSASLWFKLNLGNGLTFNNTQIHRLGNAARDGLIQVAIPLGYPQAGTNAAVSQTNAGYKFDIYRSAASVNSDYEASDDLGFVYGSQVITNLPPLYLHRAGNTNTYVTATCAGTGTHPFQVGDIINVAAVTGANAVYFNTGHFYITNIFVSSSTSFIYDDTLVGQPPTDATASISRPWTITVLDTVPDGLQQDALYTNPNQEGQAQANDPPPAAQDIALFKNSVFYANTVGLAQAVISLITVTSSNPVTSSDPNDSYYPGMAFYISGTSFGAPWSRVYRPTTPGSSSLDATQGFYPVYLPGTPVGQTVGQAIELTAQGLVAAINRDALNPYTRAAYTSLGGGFPGQITITSVTPDASVTGTSFNISWGKGIPNIVSSSVDFWPNGLFWSKEQKFEAVPQSSNWTRVGQNDKPIQRIIPLQNALVIVKEDGIWRLVGDGTFNFRIEVLDNTVRCIAPESCVSMNNKVYMLTEYGVVECTEQGVQAISTSIDDKIKELIAVAGRDTISRLAFGVADPEDRKYKLFLPTLSTDTECNQALIYDFYTQAWTRWVLNANHAIVPGNLHKLLIASTNGIVAERKNGNYTDYADYFTTNITNLTGSGSTYTFSGGNLVPGALISGSGVQSWVAMVSGTTATLTAPAALSGAYTVLSPIPSVVAWNPRLGGNIAGVNQWREVQFAFRQGNFADNQTAVTFKGDDIKNPTTYDTVLVKGSSSYGLVGPNNNGPFRIRVGVPRNEQRCTELTVFLSQSMVYNAFQVQALGCTLNQVSEKAGKK